MGRDGGRGLVNVAFVTPLRLAELLAADVLVDRKPLTNPVLGSAVRRALGADPRPFGEVADHVATEAAVARLYGELSRLMPDALQALRSDAWGDTMVGLFQRVQALVSDYHDEDAVVRAVLARPDIGAAVQPFGHIVWHLPAPLSPAQVALVAATISTAPSTVIVGLTGDTAADERVVRTCRDAGVIVESPPAAPSVCTADRIISVTDADEEVRAVLTSVLQSGRRGRPARPNRRVLSGAPSVRPRDRTPRVRRWATRQRAKHRPAGRQRGGPYAAGRIAPRRRTVAPRSGHGVHRRCTRPVLSWTRPSRRMGANLARRRGRA